MHSDSEEDFISQTIRDVDSYLAGEREQLRRDAARDNALMDEIEAHEQVRNAGVDMAGEWDSESLAAYDEWSREISDASDAYFDVICGAHGDERDPETGLCPQCAQELAEERRNDL